jgi:endonuclease-3 related protein
MSALSLAYDQLFATFGSQHWWPGESTCEIVLGAILTQNTAWTNVERALQQLRQQRLLSIAGLRNVSVEELAEWIRPAGYYRQKAQRIRNFVQFLDQTYEGSLEALFQDDLPTARQGLLSVRGIGPETADSILLYAGRFPTFVVDAYTARVLKRHGWIEPEADYDAIKDFCESQLPRDTQLFNEFHALLVRVGKDYCRKQPQCERCPLAETLPPTGPFDWNV